MKQISKCCKAKVTTKLDLEKATRWEGKTNYHICLCCSQSCDVEDHSFKKQIEYFKKRNRRDFWATLFQTIVVVGLFMILIAGLFLFIFNMLSERVV